MTLPTLFISDLHLDAQKPEGITQFTEFLANFSNKFVDLYILGDLFEVWVGDDFIEPEHQRVIDALRNLSDKGKSVFFMRGNRDFLIGSHFADLTGCTLLDDPITINLAGQTVLLMHGDLLCTDDVEYMTFREHIRNPETMKSFLASPISERRNFVQDLRKQSKQATQLKPMDIMDVNQQTVIDTMLQYDVTTLIHGHTHRPAIHPLKVANADAQRIVLGSWDNGYPSYLLWDKDGRHYHSDLNKRME